jgi:hypothetical protein
VSSGGTPQEQAARFSSNPAIQQLISQASRARFLPRASAHALNIIGGLQSCTVTVRAAVMLLG